MTRRAVVKEERSALALGIRQVVAFTLLGTEGVEHRFTGLRARATSTRGRRNYQRDHSERLSAVHGHLALPPPVLAVPRPSVSRYAASARASVTLIRSGFTPPAAALLVVLPAISLPCMFLLGGSLQQFRLGACRTVSGRHPRWYRGRRDLPVNAE